VRELWGGLYASHGRRKACPTSNLHAEVCGYTMPTLRLCYFDFFTACVLHDAKVTDGVTALANASMKKFWLLLVLAVVATGLTACRKPHDEPVSKIHGQVFVVLKSGNALKLALASVNVLPEAEAVAAADAAQAQCATTISLARTNINDAMNSLTAESSARREAARKRLAALTAEVDDMRRRQDFSESYATKVAEISDLNFELSHSENIKEKAEALQKSREGALRNYPNEFGEALTAAAKPVLSTHTNADGEFSVQIPKGRGRVALLIQASRELENVEHFVWFVWVDKLSADDGTYLFSNHNFIGSGSDANVVNIFTDVQ
jgi:hypothetical protein